MQDGYRWEQNNKNIHELKHKKKKERKGVKELVNRLKG